MATIRSVRGWSGAASSLAAGLAFAGILGLGLVAQPGPALAQSGTAGASSTADLLYRLNALDAELAGIRAQLVGVAPGWQGDSDGAAGVLSNSRVSVLEGEIRRLTATVEELRHQVRQIGAEAARRFSAIEFRLTDLEGGDVSTLQPVPPLGMSTRSDGAAAAASDRSSGSGIVPGPSGEGTFGGLPVSPSGAVQGEVTDAERAELDQAAQDVREGRFERAEDRLRRFLDAHPGSPLAGEAWYWLGESQFVNGDHGAAAQSFLKGYNANTTGPRAPENLYRLGVTLGRLGQTREACLTLREVGKQFPESPESSVARAEAEAEAAALSCD